MMYRRQFVSLNRVELSRSALLNNFDILRALGPGEVIPVLKSNAYGHGAKEVAKILNDRPISLIAVDSYPEALALMGLSKAKFLVMGAIDLANSDWIDTNRCVYVVQSKSVIDKLGKRRAPVNLHLEIDTGMHRHGIDLTELTSVLRPLAYYRNLKLDGVMTHLYDADTSNETNTIRQTKLFDAAVEKILKAGFRPSYIHIAQTAGVAKTQSRHANAIRPGIGLYGINPLAHDDPAHAKLSKLKPVMKVISRIGRVRLIKAGDSVGYNATFTAKRKMRIGVLPFGYAEGLPRSLSNAGAMKAGSTYLPIIGKVCMNHATVDLKNTNLKEGDEVTVISDNTKDRNSVDGFCRDFKFFNYRFVTAINQTIHRQIVN